MLSDTLHRSIVVTSLDASLDEANAGVDALHRIRTNGAAAAAGGEVHARDSGHSSSVAMWRAYKSAAPLTRKVLADWQSATGRRDPGSARRRKMRRALWPWSSAEHLHSERCGKTY